MPCKWQQYHQQYHFRVLLLLQYNVFLYLFMKLPRPDSFLHLVLLLFLVYCLLCVLFNLLVSISSINKWPTQWQSWTFSFKNNSCVYWQKRVILFIAFIWENHSNLNQWTWNFQFHQLSLALFVLAFMWYYSCFFFLLKQGVFKSGKGSFNLSTYHFPSISDKRGCHFILKVLRCRFRLWQWYFLETLFHIMVIFLARPDIAYSSFFKCVSIKLIPKNI